MTLAKVAFPVSLVKYHNVLKLQHIRDVYMPIGKSIRVYLADATVTGIRYAELVNWTGQAIAAPRKRLAELKNWPEAAKPGVYFLFEGRFTDNKPMAYIGESENVLYRLVSHDKSKDFWEAVIIFTSKDENLTKAHIKYLESRLVVQAKAADRFTLENGNNPPETMLPRADRDAMEEFVENIRMILGVLGYAILEPKFQDVAVKSDSNNEPNNSIDPMLDLYFKVGKLSARGAVIDEGFVLKKGSQLSKVTLVSMPARLLEIRNSFITQGKLKDVGENLVAEEDILMNSSSYAAALVAGTSRSGPQSWLSKDGVTLKLLEEKALK